MSNDRLSEGVNEALASFSYNPLFARRLFSVQLAVVLSALIHRYGGEYWQTITSDNEIREDTGFTLGEWESALASLELRGLIKVYANADPLVWGFHINREALKKLMSDHWIEYADYLKSDQWKAVRSRAKFEADMCCQICGSEYSLDVHHRTYERLGDELPEDLIVLCNNCHAKFHDKLPKQHKAKAK
jgi:hypothetical protein